MSPQRLATGPLETLLVAAVAAALLMLALPEIAVVITKARATEALLLGRAATTLETLDSAERGSTGLQSGHSGAPRRPTADAVERALSALPDDVLADLARRGSGYGSGRARPASGRLDATVDGTFIVVSGALVKDGPPLRLSWTPAIALDTPVPAVVLWLCGEQAPPPGWYALRDPVPSALPGATLFAACRAGHSPQGHP